MRDWNLLRKTSQHSLIYFCSFVIIIQLIVIFFPALYPGKEVLDRYRLLHIAIAFVMGLFLFFADVPRRSYWTKTMATVFFLILVLPVFPFVFLRNLWGAHQNYPFFEGAKLVLVFLGVLVPVSVTINAVLVAILIVEVFVLWYGFGVGASSHFLDPDQPVIVMVYMLISFGLLFFRWRYERLTQREADAIARAKVLEEYAKVFLELKDRANNPLQTLALSIALLERTNPETPRLHEIRSSLKKLSEINEILGHYDFGPFFDKK